MLYDVVVVIYDDKIIYFYFKCTLRKYKDGKDVNKEK